MTARYGPDWRHRSLQSSLPPLQAPGTATAGPAAAPGSAGQANQLGVTSAPASHPALAGKEPGLTAAAAKLLLPPIGPICGDRCGDGRAPDEFFVFFLDVFATDVAELAVPGRSDCSAAIHRDAGKPGAWLAVLRHFRA